MKTQKEIFERQVVTLPKGMSKEDFLAVYADAAPLSAELGEPDETTLLEFDGGED
jgi:hypothetical protein